MHQYSIRLHNLGNWLIGLGPVCGYSTVPVMHGQCIARPTVTFPASGHCCPLTSTKLYCLVTEAHKSWLKATAWGHPGRTQTCDLWIVLLRIPNRQPNPRIFSGVRPSLNPRIIFSRKWRFWVICSRVNIYLSGGGVQATLRNCAWPPVQLRETLNKPAAADRLTAPHPRCLVGHSRLCTHQWRLSVVTSQLQIIIWSNKSGRVTDQQLPEVAAQKIGKQHIILAFAVLRVNLHCRT